METVGGGEVVLIRGMWFGYAFTPSRRRRVAQIRSLSIMEMVEKVVVVPSIMNMVPE